MQFDSVEALIAMSGYGLYVWSSYLVFAAAVSGLVIATRLEYRRILLDQKRRARMEPGNAHVEKE